MNLHTLSAKYMLTQIATREILLKPNIIRLIQQNAQTQNVSTSKYVEFVIEKYIKYHSTQYDKTRAKATI